MRVNHLSSDHRPRIKRPDNFLDLVLVQKMTAQEIGDLAGVHSATVSKWATYSGILVFRVCPRCGIRHNDYKPGAKGKTPCNDCVAAGIVTGHNGTRICTECKEPKTNARFVGETDICKLCARASNQDETVNLVELANYGKASAGLRYYAQGVVDDPAEPTYWQRMGLEMMGAA